MRVADGAAAVLVAVDALQQAACGDLVGRLVRVEGEADRHLAVGEHLSQHDIVGRELRPNAGIAELDGARPHRARRAAKTSSASRMTPITPARKPWPSPRWSPNTIGTASLWSPPITTPGAHRYIFQHIFPDSVNVRVASARDGDYDPDHWWEIRKSIKIFTRELGGMLVAIWELRGDTRHESQSVVGRHGRGAIPGGIAQGNSTFSRHSIVVYTG